MIHKFAFGRALVCLTLLAWLNPGLIAENSAAGSKMRVTNVMGLAGIANNASGNISIQENALRFQKAEGLAAQIGIGSIQGLFLGEQDKQVGGVPMAIGRTAAPYGGGRVIGLFSHKKYDTL